MSHEASMASTSNMVNGFDVSTIGELEPDLLVMGAHGHGGIKDLIFGNTINPVRHRLNIPILVVRES